MFRKKGKCELPVVFFDGHFYAVKDNKPNLRAKVKVVGEEFFYDKNAPDHNAINGHGQLHELELGG